MISYVSMDIRSIDSSNSEFCKRRKSKNYLKITQDKEKKIERNKKCENFPTWSDIWWSSEPHA